VRCSLCGREVEKGIYCPVCGEVVPLETKQKWRNSMILVIVLLLVFAIVFLLNGNASEEETTRYMTSSEAVLRTEQSDVSNRGVVESETSLVPLDEVRLIYATKTGKRYHYRNPCGSGDFFPISEAEAAERGLTPCQKCVQ